MKAYIKTFGCQMNVADSEYIASILSQNADIELTEDITEADVVIINTCSVRKHAEDRAASFIGKIKKLKRDGKPIIFVIGCFVQKEEEELKKRFSFVDVFLGPKEYNYIEEILNKCLTINITQKIHIPLFNKVSTFVPIMTGCNNFCSYCIVPYVRGEERSRPQQEIILEVMNLLRCGVKEITLLGQNVNSYKSKEENKEIGFAELLEKVASLTNLGYRFWVRFLTNHPKDMSYDIIKVMKKYPNISRHIHLPLQSGSDRILALMNRNYTVEKYKDIVKMIRQEISEVSITTDLIVGFPSETEEDFLRTLSLVKEIQFDGAFVFKYSPREKTKAFELVDDVPKQVKEERHFKLLKLCDKISEEKNKKYLGKILEVLVISKDFKKNKYIAKTLNNKTVEINSDDKNLLGEFINVKIEDVKFHTLIGKAL